jgi:Ca2+-binding RTX toxin-like protein
MCVSANKKDARLNPSPGRWASFVVNTSKAKGGAKLVGVGRAGREVLRDRPHRALARRCGQRRDMERDRRHPGTPTASAVPPSDRLLGLEGNDVIRGRAAEDRLVGGPGDDVPIGGPGQDVYICGGGDEVVIIGSSRVAGQMERFGDGCEAAILT